MSLINQRKNLKDFYQIKKTYVIMDKKIKDFIEKWKKRLRFPKMTPPTCPA